jgi:hypothetical protein
MAVVKVVVAEQKVVMVGRVVGNGRAASLLLKRRGHNHF